MIFFDALSRILTRFGFIFRYFWHLMSKYGRLQLDWFVFLEPRVVFKISPGSTVHIKKDSYIKSGAVFEASNNGRIILEKRTNIGHYTCIGASNLVHLGKNTIIGQACTLVDSAHIHNPAVSLDKSGYHYGQLILEDNITVYPKATLGSNIRIARGTVIGAHAFVNKNIEEENGLYVGIPARRVRDI
ncbi:hypothetical protein MASR1M90_06950 [Desulfovibrionales bacterium]